jgi:uncharacterized protein
LLVVVGVALIAAIVNGAIGYGFSSITVPAALLFHLNRVLNTALVLVELLLNALAVVLNRKALPRIFRPTVPLLLGAVPGVILGSWGLSRLSPELLRMGTYAVLLPLIIVQTTGARWPVSQRFWVGAPVGAGVGALYAATTISGPPLALLFNNQGLAKDEFRAALSLFRLVESTLTAIAYLAMGLFTYEAATLSIWLVPAVLIGMPVGYWLVKPVEPETFRRSVMAIDALLVSYGLARVSVAQGLLGRGAYLLVAAVAVIETWVVFRFFRARAKEAED